MKSTEYTSWF